MGKKLDRTVCVVNGQTNCCPEVCTALKEPPQIHATFLFKHLVGQCDEDGITITKAGAVAGLVEVGARSLYAILREFQEQQVLQCTRASGQTIDNLGLKGANLLSAHNAHGSGTLEVIPDNRSIDLKDLSEFPALSSSSRSPQHGGECGQNPQNKSKCGHLAETIAMLMCLSDHLALWQSRSSHKRDDTSASASAAPSAASENGTHAESRVNTQHLGRSGRSLGKRSARRAAAASRVSAEQQSAPAVMADPSHCLPLSAFVLTSKAKPLHCLDMNPESELWGAGTTSLVTVSSCARQQLTDCDFMTIGFCLSPGTVAACQITVTTSHVLNIMRQTAGRWEPTFACDVHVGDMLRTAKGKKATIIDVMPYTDTAEVVEVTLREVRNTCFVRTSESGTYGLDAFVEVYGNLAPIGSQSSVEILRIKWRPNNFKELLLESPELEGCRNAQWGINISCDLVASGLGPGKLLVGPQFAPRALAALHLRGEATKASDIVVSAQFKPIVLQLLEKHARKQQVPTIAVLELPPKLKVVNTSLDFDDEQTSLHTQSTPNAYTWNPSRNPHAKVSLQRSRASQLSLWLGSRQLEAATATMPVFKRVSTTDVGHRVLNHG